MGDPNINAWKLSIKVIGIIIPTAITTPGIEYPIEKIFNENLVYKLLVDLFTYDAYIEIKTIITEERAAIVTVFIMIFKNSSLNKCGNYSV